MTRQEELTKLAQLAADGLLPLEELLENVRGLIVSRVSEQVEDYDQAEEVIQIVSVALWKWIGSYDSAKGPFYPWLARLIRQRVKEWKKTQPKVQYLEETKRSTLPVVEPVLDYEEDILSVLGAYIKEPEFVRLAYLKWVKGWTPKELAELSGYNARYISNKLSIYRKELQKSDIREYLGGEE